MVFTQRITASYSTPRKEVYDINLEEIGQRVEVTVTKHCQEVEAWITSTKKFIEAMDLNHPPVIGIYGEYDRFKRDGRNKKPSVLTLCSGRRCLLIQLEYLPFVPDELKKFWEDEALVFVTRRPLVPLEIRLSEQNVKTRRFVCIHHLFHNHSAASPLEDMLGAIRPRSSLNHVSVLHHHEVTSSSRWCRGANTQDQIFAAAVEAFSAFKLGLRMKAWQYVR